MVLKVPGALLRGWLRTPDRYCALSFDASSGAGWLFASMWIWSASSSGSSWMAAKARRANSPRSSW